MRILIGGSQHKLQLGRSKFLNFIPLELNRVAPAVFTNIINLVQLTLNKP